MEREQDQPIIPPIQRNFIDDIIRYVNPMLDNKRMYARAQGFILQDNMRKYNMGAYSRRTANWDARATSANAEVTITLPILRARSREMVRNNPYAKRAVQAIRTNTIGLGIRPRPVYKGKAAKVTDKLKEAWNEFANSTSCDFDGSMNFYGLQGLIVGCLAESGECLIRRRYDSRNKIHLQFQVLEPDLLDHRRDTPISIGPNGVGEYTIQGVKFNSNGRRVGYWMFDRHPGDGFVGMSTLVPITDIVHLYKKERPGQVRGVPFITTSAMTLRDFDEYEQAQLIRQKIAACFAVFIQDIDASTITPSGQVAADNMFTKVEPGMIDRLPAGKTVTFANPPTVQNYEEYATAMLRKVAAGMGISYEVLTGDLSNVNFSSARMGWIEFNRMIQELQTLILIPSFCDIAWDWFLDSAVLSGVIKLSHKQDINVTWTPPRREMIDPVKETKALNDMIRAGIISWERAILETGQDPEVALQEIVSSFKSMDDNDLMLTSNPKYDPTRSNGALPPDDDSMTEEKDEPTGKQKKSMTKKPAK